MQTADCRPLSLVLFTDQSTSFKLHLVFIWRGLFPSIPCSEHYVQVWNMKSKFGTWGPSFVHEVQVWNMSSKFAAWGPNLVHEVQVWNIRSKFGTWGPSLEHEVQVWCMRPGLKELYNFKWPPCKMTMFNSLRQGCNARKVNCGSVNSVFTYWNQFSLGGICKQW